LPNPLQTWNRPTSAVISPTKPDNAMLASLVCRAPAAELFDSSRIRGAGGLDGGIERQQVGLLGHRADHLQHLANIPHLPQN